VTAIETGAQASQPAQPAQSGPAGPHVPPSHSQAPRFDAVPARRLIFWLFAALAVATAVTLLVFVHTPQGWPYRVIVYRGLAGNLALPVVAWFILSGIGSRGVERAFWFLGALPAGLITMALVMLALMAFGAL